MLSANNKIGGSVPSSFRPCVFEQNTEPRFVPNGQQVAHSCRCVTGEMRDKM